MKRLYIGGTFDLLHVGHINIFKRCKEIGFVIVSVNTDDFVSRYKREPIIPFEQRIEMIRSCEYVDLVIENVGCEDSKPSILDSGATHIVHGDDWTGEGLMKQMGITQEWLDEHGIEMLYMPYTKSISTTEIINKIRK